MDPNATLRAISDLIGSLPALGTRDDSMDRLLEAYGHCDALRDWLVRGGFEPKWANFPQASRFYQERVAKAGGR